MFLHTHTHTHTFYPNPPHPLIQTHTHSRPPPLLLLESAPRWALHEKRAVSAFPSPSLRPARETTVPSPAVTARVMWQGCTQCTTLCLDAPLQLPGTRPTLLARYVRVHRLISIVTLCPVLTIEPVGRPILMRSKSQYLADHCVPISLINLQPAKWTIIHNIRWKKKCCLCSVLFTCARL